MSGNKYFEALVADILAQEEKHTMAGCDDCINKHPYRTNANVEEPAPPLPTAHHPKLTACAQWLTGVITLLSIGLVLWIVFPGVYYLGTFIDNHFSLGILYNSKLTDFGKMEAGWMIGILTMTIPFVLIFLPKRIGKMIFAWKDAPEDKD